MEYEDNPASAVLRIELPEELTIMSVAQWKETLSGFISRSPIELDGAAVSRIDTAGLQLLLTFFRDARDAGADIRWCRISSNISEATRRLGLDTVLTTAETGSI